MDTFRLTTAFYFTAVPEFFLMGSILLAIVAAKPSYLLFVPGFLVTKFTNPLFKWGTKKVLKKAGKRPTGCGMKIGNQCTGCGNCPEPGKISKTYGMPSGHAASMGYTLVFIALTLAQNKERYKYYDVSITLLVFVTLTVGLQRIIIGCHNIAQVLMGYVIGAIWGILFYMLASVIDSNTFPTLW